MGNVLRHPLRALVPVFVLTLFLSDSADAAQWPGLPPPEFMVPSGLVAARPQARPAFQLTDDIFKRLRNEKGEPIHLRWSPTNTGLRTIGWHDSKGLQGKPEAVALDFLSRWRSIFGIGELSDLAVRDVTRYVEAFTRVSFAQVHRGPIGPADVLGAGVEIYMTPANGIWHVFNRYVPNVYIKDPPKVPKPEGCIDGVRSTLKLDRKYSPTELKGPLVLAQQTGDAYVHRLVFAVDKPFGTWEVLVSASDCKILLIRDLVRYFDGTGVVFDPNPVLAALPRPPPSPVTAVSLARPETLTELSSPDLLAGKYADVSKTTDLARNANHEFAYSPPTSKFAQTMAYFHVTRTLKRFESLLPRAENKPPLVLPVQIDAFGECRKDGLSCYQPRGQRGPIIILGREWRGIADAEDGHVIVHELGHALMGQLSPEFEASTALSSQALAEGFSDYLALRVWAGTKFETRCVAPWYALRSASTGASPCLRRVEAGDKGVRPDWSDPAAPWKYAHLWSSALWDLRERLRGPDVNMGDADIDRIIFDAHAALGFNATTYTPAIHMINSALRRKGEQVSKLVEQFLKDRGLL